MTDLDEEIERMNVVLAYLNLNFSKYNVKNHNWAMYEQVYFEMFGLRTVYV